jgi:hypothetical protein
MVPGRQMVDFEHRALAEYGGLDTSDGLDKYSRAEHGGVTECGSEASPQHPPRDLGYLHLVGEYIYVQPWCNILITLYTYLYHINHV